MTRIQTKKYLKTVKSDFSDLPTLGQAKFFTRLNNKTAKTGSGITIALSLTACNDSSVTLIPCADTGAEYGYICVDSAVSGTTNETSSSTISVFDKTSSNNATPFGTSDNVFNK